MGKEFMNAKKVEMNQAIKDDTLQQWVDESIQNYNVWTYHYFSGDAPDIPNYHVAGFELISRENTPLQNLISVHNPFWYDPQAWIIAGVVGLVILVSTVIVWRMQRSLKID